MNNASYRALINMGRAHIRDIARAAKLSQKQTIAQIGRAVKKGYVKVIVSPEGETIFEARQRRLL